MPEQTVSNLRVIVLPHSHDDTGWQRTVDEYYEEEVRYIYDSVVQSLLANTDRKFVFVETAYFMRWWRQQNAAVRTDTLRLFKNGQLEFINGGWCMADDASPGWDAFIDQTTLGHRYIADTLGPEFTPRYAWHIDPFGLSASYSVWFKSMNFSGWIFNRIDTRLKDLWHNETKLQFHWNPTTDNAGTSLPGTFSHVLDTHYGAPSIQYKGTNYHFDWEVFGGLGGGEAPGSQFPVPAAPPSQFYPGPTIDEIAEAFVAICRLRAQWYALGPPHQRVPKGTGAILVPFGDDMKFQNAHKQYSNMDRLMRYINDHSDRFGLTVEYGTMSDYMDLLEKEDPTLWPVFDQDFMPLGTNNNIYTSQIDWNVTMATQTTEYWTGHYTTRPFMKQLAAQAEHIKHTSEIAAAVRCAHSDAAAGSPPPKSLACGNSSTLAATSDLLTARTVTSVLEHHDSITGTSKPDVTTDLDMRLEASIAASKRVLGQSILSSGFSEDEPVSASRGPLVVRLGDNFSLWNGMLREQISPITLLLDAKSVPTTPSTSVGLLDAGGKRVASALVPPVPVDFEIAGNPLATSNNWTLVFTPSIPALTTSLFRVVSIPAGATTPQWDCQNMEGPDVDIASDSIRVTFDGKTRRMREVQLPREDDASPLRIAVEQQFLEYHSTPSSNAYQFLPNRTQYPFGEPLELAAGAPSLCVYRHPLLQRVVQTYGAPHRLRETVSLYTGLGSSAAQVETRTDFIMVTQDRELVTRYMTSLRNSIAGSYYNSTKPTISLPVFETDSNGYLMLQRVTNNTAWTGEKNRAYYHVAKPVAGNYYPLTGAPGSIRICTRPAMGGACEDGPALAVLTDTAHGAAALEEGWVEIMMGRRCYENGGISVNDTDPVSLGNWLVFGAAAPAAARIQREWAATIATPLIPVIGEPAAQPRVPVAQMPGGLPPGLHLLSLDRVGVETSDPAAEGDHFLMRLANLYQHGEGPHAVTLKIDVGTVLSATGVCLSSITEVPLNGISRAGVGAGQQLDVKDTIDLDPLQIRTFDVTLQGCH